MTYEIAVAEIRSLHGAINRYQNAVEALIDDLEEIKDRIGGLEAALRDGAEKR